MDSVLNDKEFHEVYNIVKKKQKQLKSIGKETLESELTPLVLYLIRDEAW